MAPWSCRRRASSCWSGRPGRANRRGPRRTSPTTSCPVTRCAPSSVPVPTTSPRHVTRSPSSTPPSPSGWRRRLTTVVDSLGSDAARRDQWRAAARAAGVACIAVLFDTPAAEVRRRNRRAPGPSSRRGRCAASWPSGRRCATHVLAEPFDAHHIVAAGERAALVAPVLSTHTPAARVGDRRASPALRAAAAAVHLAGRSGRARRPPARRRPAGRGRRVRLDLGDGPLPPDPPDRSGVGGHARELDDARPPRRGHRADPPRHARHRDHLPQRRPPGQDRRHARRAVGRPRRVRHRARLVRAGVDHVIVSLVDVADPGAIERYAAAISACRVPR